jgi:hypothetical protein
MFRARWPHCVRKAGSLRNSSLAASASIRPTSPRSSADDALGADFGFYEIDTAGKTVPVEPASVKAA